MKTQSQDEILNYVMLPRNLAATLDIVKRATQIRSVALGEFWMAVETSLKRTAPSLCKRNPHMQWGVWPNRDSYDDTYRDLWYWDRRQPEEVLSLGYDLSQHLTDSSFGMGYGISWSHPKSKRSRVHRLRQVVMLRQTLDSDVFQSKAWWLGYAKLFLEEAPVEEFLKRYARDPKPVHERICRDFWQLVEDTFQMVVEANRAIHRMLPK